MLERSGVRLLARNLVGVFALALAACTSPGSQRIIGPDGSAMAHVHCGSDQGVCFRLAGELCPGGYEMKPVLSGNDGNFLVRCRDARVAQNAAACPAVTTAVPIVTISKQLPAKTKDAWPPATEPWPATYPWPPPETSAAVQTKPGGSPAAKPEQDNVDIGY